MDVYIYIIYIIQRVNNGILKCILPYSTHTHRISIGIYIYIFTIYIYTYNIYIYNIYIYTIYIYTIYIYIIYDYVIFINIYIYDYFQENIKTRFWL